MPTTEMVAMVAVVAALALGFIHLLRLLSTAIMHRTVRRAIDKDPAAAESLLAQLGKPPERTGDDRLSTILVAVGIAMIAGAIVAVDDPAAPRWHDEQLDAIILGLQLVIFVLADCEIAEPAD